MTITEQIESLIEFTDTLDEYIALGKPELFRASLKRDLNRLRDTVTNVKSRI